MKAYTDYFSEDCATVEEVKILSYDNDKYATILLNCEERYVKRHFVFKDKEQTKQFSIVDWFVLGGGKRQNFKMREKKIEWDISFNGLGKRHEFSTKKAAIKAALLLAKKHNRMVEVWAQRSSRYSHSSGWVILEVYPDGIVQQFYGNVRHARGSFAKRLRGHGKLYKGCLTEWKNHLK